MSVHAVNLVFGVRPLRGLQETRVATREESGVLGFPSRRRLTPRGSLECNPDGVSHEVRQGAQGASHVAPGKSGLHVRGEGERVLALESREGTRASRRVEAQVDLAFIPRGLGLGCS